jgi:5-methylcytosine-specific restriction endonuclease McrA
MSQRIPKSRPRRLSPTPYELLRSQVLKRDRWRCQYCGKARDLHVHHLQPRSHQGEDTELNLITLCARCHALVHRRN